MKKPQHMLMCGVSMLTLCSTASAQTDDAPLTSVTVTGSRVIRNGDSNPSPTTVMSSDDLMTAKPGSTLADALNTLPVFAGSRGSASNPTTAGSAAGGSGSANQLNLRNIGATRTLVLMMANAFRPRCTTAPSMST
ncbi:TonB-dependent receptor plug domain-containing protein [Duganella levis]|uniref:TonB-dependent receptor plug domain-containing protein n=1 Tax=Duganella levis TaxID=2692169 RepID=UPI001E3FF5B5|nr:TonB-dependent receptor plug domain-containing protein [Duganella levis]